MQGGFPLLPANLPLELQGEEEVLLDGQRRDEVEELEDEADPLAAEEGPLPLGEGREGDAVDDHLARVRLVDARQQVEQGGLPRAAAPDEHRQLSAGERSIRGAQHHPPPAPFLVGLSEIAELDEASGGGGHGSGMVSPGLVLEPAGPSHPTKKVSRNLSRFPPPRALYG